MSGARVKQLWVWLLQLGASPKVWSGSRPFASVEPHASFTLTNRQRWQTATQRSTPQQARSINHDHADDTAAAACAFFMFRAPL
jgi:hypothetical protein